MRARKETEDGRKAVQALSTVQSTGALIGSKAMLDNLCCVWLIYIETTNDSFRINLLLIYDWAFKECLLLTQVALKLRIFLP